jgi:hypothetical protein
MKTAGASESSGLLLFKPFKAACQLDFKNFHDKIK